MPLGAASITRNSVSSAPLDVRTPRLKEHFELCGTGIACLLRALARALEAHHSLAAEADANDRPAERFEVIDMRVDSAVRREVQEVQDQVRGWRTRGNLGRSGRGRREEGVDLGEGSFELFRIWQGRRARPHAFPNEHFSVPLDDTVKVAFLPRVRLIGHETTSSVPVRVLFDPVSPAFPTCRVGAGRRVEQSERVAQENVLLDRVEVVGQDRQGRMRRLRISRVRSRARAAAGTAQAANAESGDLLSELGQLLKH